MTPETDFERLEEALVRAGKAVPYPATPPLARRVGERLAAERSPRGLGELFRHRKAARVIFAVAAALALALALLLAFPDAREALAGLLGLRTVRIFVAPPTTTPSTAPIAPPQNTASPMGRPGQTPGTATTQRPIPTETPMPLGLCCETTLAEAQRQARFKLLLPPDETPSRVYFQELGQFGNAQQVVLVFGNPQAPRFTLYEAESIIYGKVLFALGGVVEPGTIIAETAVKGHDARWLSGAPHVLVYLDPRGTPMPRTERTVNANTLVWEEGDVTFRLETSLSEEQAKSFAESLR